MPVRRRIAASSSPVAQVDAVVIARHPHAAVIVFHGGQQLRQSHGRVGHVIAIVPAVQRRARTKDGKGDQRGAAVAQHQRGPVARMARSVVNDDGIAGQQRRVALNDLGHGGRAHFFLAVDQHLEMVGRRPPRGTQAVNGREQHHDGGLVIR